MSCSHGSGVKHFTHSTSGHGQNCRSEIMYTVHDEPTLTMALILIPLSNSTILYHINDMFGSKRHVFFFQDFNFLIF